MYKGVVSTTELAEPLLSEEARQDEEEPPPTPPLYEEEVPSAAAPNSLCTSPKAHFLHPDLLTTQCLSPLAHFFLKPHPHVSNKSVPPPSLACPYSAYPPKPTFPQFCPTPHPQSCSTPTCPHFFPRALLQLPVRF